MAEREGFSLRLQNYLLKSEAWRGQAGLRVEIFGCLDGISYPRVVMIDVWKPIRIGRPFPGCWRN